MQRLKPLILRGSGARRPVAGKRGEETDTNDAHAGMAGGSL